MRRPRLRKPTANMSLFPFLAVLICTMGALIVLLVLVVQEARVQADTITETRAKELESQREEQQKLLEAEEDQLWRREVLETQRAVMTDKLAEKRLELSHLEDHIRRLEQRLARLQAEAQQMQQLSLSRGEQTESARFELARLEAEIHTEQKLLEKARAEAKRRRNSYAIVPYDGPNGTRRRPIYIECSQDGIVIQPEGVVLQPRDFAGPLGPGNPLDATLRAIREYWARVAPPGRSSGEPYPLLIVRPDGAVAYSMARQALSAWDDEFGYELIEQELQLEYPEADERLRTILTQTIATARQRQAMLAAAMPRRFDTPIPTDFTAEPYDGESEAFGAGGVSDGATGPNRSGTNRGFGRGPHTTATTNVGSTSPTGTRGPYSGHEQASQAAQSGQGNGAARTTSHASGTGASSRPGDTSGGGSGVAGTDQNGNGGTATAPGGAACTPLSKTRGSNWALPDDTRGSTGITRPIAVECYADRLVILPDSSSAQESVVVPVKGAMRGSIEGFVSSVWTRIDHWGMAVAGGYWKPLLKVRVAPDALDRYRELEILLEDSGIDIQQK